MNKNKRAPVKVTYRKGLNVGASAAEQDGSFLNECFVDNGSVDIITDLNRNESIILGRVGAGKSALIQEVSKSKPCLIIDPQEFSLTHIENSEAIKLLKSLGVSLDALFQALWKHVLTLEIIRAKTRHDKKFYGIDSLERFFRRRELKQAEKDALAYFDEFGGSDFWQTTELRVKEIIARVERSVDVELGGRLKAISSSLSSNNTTSDQERSEYVTLCQKAVNGVQIQKLHRVVSALGTVLEDSDQEVYILIDDLDTNWANSEVRFRLIRALMETIKKFRKIRNVKIIIALRIDLLDTVIRATRDSGFQEEKFEDFFFRLRWTAADLVDVLDRRIRKIFKDQYTRTDVGFFDVFPEKIGSRNTAEYITDRIADRPRDAVLFMNFILGELEGKTQITKRVIVDAERDYSASRASSICTEWADLFPNLDKYLMFLKGMDSRFLVRDLSISKLNDFVMDCVSLDREDDVVVAASDVVDKGKSIETVEQALGFLQVLLGALMRVGAIGAKFDSTGRPEWAENRVLHFVGKPFELNTQIHVHPMLFRYLGVRPIGRK